MSTDFLIMVGMFILGTGFLSKVLLLELALDKKLLLRFRGAHPTVTAPLDDTSIVIPYLLIHVVVINSLPNSITILMDPIDDESSSYILSRISRKW